ncbi:MAG: phosphoribosylformylglycinamidine synthase [Candidatus Peregrinibacteria bacterium Greene0416_19]|nr:MAG: phosphoribosylformylglycinamidine synthase [Candidatus Peregrinibacteria bacterium Greene0416_19]
MEDSTKPAATVLPFSTLSDVQMKEELAKHRIGLTVEEARKISVFLGRDPTLVEATVWGIQGSEHCSYKSSRRFLRAFPTSGRHVILGPKEDSGIVAITDGPAGMRWGIVVSHESHNHPSQIVPFEGAATGVGGTVRDVVCMGARVIGCMDMLRLGDLQSPDTRNIAKEVARGIGGYGNPLGIPNLGGDTVFDSAYNNNCLVNAIAIGLVREDEVIHSIVPEEAGRVGYDIVVVGKPTDRSGFGGASFASVTMEEESKEQNTGAVQEPNPFLERHLLISTYALFDWLAQSGHLPRVSFKDLGAGGVVCASVEQVAERGFGARVDLDKVHTSVHDLPAEVVACAETQERFCWICHPDLTEHILQHYNTVWDLPCVAEGARASCIGKVTPDGMYTLSWKGNTVCYARAADLTSGLQYARPTVSVSSDSEEPTIIEANGSLILHTRLGPYRTTIPDVFRRMLRHPNHASKAAFVRHFDTTVIGQTIIEAGEADAAVILPLRDVRSYLPGTVHDSWQVPEDLRHTAVAVAADGNSRYGRISAYHQGFMAAIEAMCNVAAVGALPRALTDCLNYGNPEVPEQLGALEDGVRGIADAARGVLVEGECVPVISGNVSLYNSTPDGAAISPSAIVCCIGVARDATRTCDMRCKSAGSALLFIGSPVDECGGSAYYEVLEAMAGLQRDALLGRNVPSPDTARISEMIGAVTSLISSGCALSCHDVSDGGLLLALFEMLLPQRGTGGTLGAEVDLDAFKSGLRNDTLLFSQSPAFVLEVPLGKADASIAQARKHDMAAYVIGSVSPQPQLIIQRSGSIILRERLPDLCQIWQDSLPQALDRLC